MNEILALVIVAILCISAMLIQSYWHQKRTNLKDALLLQSELLKERQSSTLPLKMEAFQRAILYLERMNPTSLVLRLSDPSISAKAMEAVLLKALRDEYDHNVAQQLFISEGSWKLLKTAKEETVRLISLVAEQLPEGASLPSEIAIEALKAEFQRLM
ncbi:MAG: hypothetical protein EBU82_07875 [Flavobacteriia bacterium]|nr:hypothetical protein [Flavobacteriia bacterium]